MVLGGYQAFSLCDYPGLPSAVIFTQGCNWRCPFCHNGELWALSPAEGAGVEVDEVIGLLRERQGLLRAVVVTGGEPTIQPDLPHFLSQLRTLGLKVKLDTNGSNPLMLDSILRAGLVDYVAMDIKGPIALYERLTGCPADTGAVLRSISLIAAAGIPHQFRTTWVPHLLAESDRPGILEMVPAGSPHVWQKYVPVEDGHTR